MMMVSRWITALLALSASLMCYAAGPAQAQIPSSFGQYRPTPAHVEALTTSQYLTMRDGVQLAVSVTHPANGGKPVAGKFPVIWHHTLRILPAGRYVAGPPGARLRDYDAVPTLAYHGYVVVQVARRGQGPSFGKRRGYNDRTEAYDAYELIDWMATQPWSTGSVGVYGCSNTGDASMHAVTAANPRLKAAWAGCFSWEKYDGFWRGGIFANWGTGPERTIEQDMSNIPVQGDESKVLLRQAAEEHQGAGALARMWAAMPFRDDYAAAPASRFWYEGSVASYLPQIRSSGTAIYVQGGWRDDLRGQGLVTYANLSGDRHLILGPWGHCDNDDLTMLAEMHRFFDQHLKGLGTGILSDDPIHYFTVNAPAGKEWRSSKIWPVAGTQPTNYYLASTGATDGQLLRTLPAATTASTRFKARYDVECPTLKPRPDGLLTGAPPCPAEQGGPRFVSEPLTTDTEVTGDAIADLWISTTADDVNVFVYLEDVAADGTVTQVTDARLKASLRKLGKPRYDNRSLPYHRSHREDAQPLKANEPTRLVFSFLPTSHVFKTGHRIRIAVAASDYRERDRTPVVPAPLITIHNDAEHRSFVTLPVIAGHAESAAIETTLGKLPDGTDYRIDFPQNWNGAVLVGLDYAGRGDPLEGDVNAGNRQLLSQGFAMAGTTRKVTGWAIHLAAANAVHALDLFEARHGKAKYAIEFGSSQGGHVAAFTVQAYPNRWHGALAQCGGLSGSVAQWRGKLDGLFVAKTLLAPKSNLPVINIPKDFQTSALPAWREVIESARQTPEGRARIALAAVIAQLPDWSDGRKPRPQPEDLEARQAGLHDSMVVGVALLNQAMSSRAQIEALSGGNISSNVGVDYARLLKETDRDGLIGKLYKAAGIDLKADLAALARAPRIEADPKAIAYVASGVFDGGLKVPVLTVNGIGDAISVVSSQQSYEAAVKAAGKETLLRQTYTASAGHCGFTPAESVAAVNTLLHRLKTGHWDNTNAEAMNHKAQQTHLGQSRFIDYTPARFVRPYTACDLSRELRAAKLKPIDTSGQTLPACARPL